MEKEITTTNQTTALADSLIVVQQLPIIKEQLHSIKAQAQESVKEALSLACTEETLKVVKERRAALNRDRKDLDARRMAVKKQIMQPFEDFDEVYKECVTDVYGPADEALKGKITDVEAGLKADKEKKVKDYFAEMVKASGVEWVTYEDVGVAVTLTASLKSLKAKVKEYVEKVAADVACIVILIMAVLSVVAIRFGYKALLIEWAIDAISKAEKEFVGTKLGEARLAVVVSWLREKVPAPIRFLVTDDLIRKAVQTSFNAAKSGLEVLKNA